MAATHPLTHATPTFKQHRLLRTEITIRPEAIQSAQVLTDQLNPIEYMVARAYRNDHHP